MSIDTDPDLYAFAAAPDVCLTCFAAGKSPDSIFLSLNGIIKGPLAAGGDPAPPNGIIELPVTGPCTFAIVAAGVNYAFSWSPIATSVQVNTGALFFFTTAFPGGICNRHIPNDQQAPGADKYYGGWCDVLIPTDSDADSLPDILNAMGMPMATGTYASPRVLDADFDVYTLSRRSDNSNLHVKIETL